MKSLRRTVPARVTLLLALAALVVACGAEFRTPVPALTDIPAGASATPFAAASPSATASPAADWPTYHRDNSRSGYDPAFPDPGPMLTVAWSVNVRDAVYASPLVVHGRVIVASEGDNVFALEPATGKTIWSRSLGTPVRRATLPCGNIDPLGITGTPAYDSQTNSIFLVAEVEGPRHVMFALNADDGSVRWSRGVDLPGDDPRTHQQRTAVAVANGFAYFGFGGLAGDCGQYTGKVIGVPVSGQGDLVAYRVPTKREGAVWATGNPVVDDSGNLYVSTGNGSSTTRYDGSDSVVQLSPDLKMQSSFAPSSWAHENATDADLGSLGPMVVPGGFVFIAGKSGIGYVLRQGALGGIGGQVSQAPVCRAFGGAARRDTTIYVPCRDRLRAVQITADGKLHVGWTSSAAGGPPVVGHSVVWSVSSAGILEAIDFDGKTVAGISVGAVPHFASPALYGNLVLVPTMRGVAAVRV